MKVLIVSDIHGGYDNLLKVINDNKGFNYLLILGDILSSYSGEELINLLNSYNTKIIAVRGNCDNMNIEKLDFSLENYFVVTPIDNKLFFLTHGHLYEVKHDRSLSVLKREGRKCSADVILFGHTHEPYYEVNNGIILLNPGTIGEGSSLSYGVLQIEDGTARGKIKSVKTE